MSTRLIRSLVTVLAIVGGACSSSSIDSSGTGGASAQGGAAGSGQSGTGGANGTGGASQGGSQSKPTGSGGTVTPGTGGATGTGGGTVSASGGAGAGGRLGSGGTAASTNVGGSTSPATGGTSALGGSTGPGAGGSTASTGTSADVSPSAGCGKAKTLANGTIPITFNGASRKYILKVPDNYDNKHPYRLVIAYAESGSSAQSVADRNYFTMAALDTGKTSIFAAPDAANGAGSWSKADVELTDAILAQLEGDLCIDKTRIFATGFSFGGAMSIAVACTRADVFRAVAFFSGADLTNSCPATLTKPIAYYASQASGDSSGAPSPTSGRTIQAKFAAVNGCTADPSAIEFPAAGQPHTCTIYKGCSAGHPTVYCVFNGGHGWEPKDPGQSTSWDAPEAWKFINQF